MLLHVDFSLDFVLEQARITQPFAHRRLNAFENTVTGLAKRWRPRLPPVPGRELRMSDETPARPFSLGSRRRSPARDIR